MPEKLIFKLYIHARIYTYVKVVYEFELAASSIKKKVSYVRQKARLVLHVYSGGTDYIIIATEKKVML